MAGPERDLLVLRHAKADRGDTADFDRPLTGRGRRDARRMGIWLRDRGLFPDMVVASPSCRTRETAEIAAEALGIGRDRLRFEQPAYEGGVPDLLAAIAVCPETCARVLLVVHNPGAEALVRGLARTVREPDDGKFFPTAALAHLRVASEWRDLKAGTADLVSIVRPRDLDG